jgi:hybrid cluster-associated redox disulfide protein
VRQPQLESDLLVAEVMTRWPQTIPVFIRHRLACVGCAIAPFETLAEVAAIYSLDLDHLLDELEQAINSKPVNN